MAGGRLGLYGGAGAGAWELVRAAISAEDPAAVAALVSGFGDAERRQVAGELAGHIPAAAERGEVLWRERDDLREAC
ncbi:hypothetical protein D5H75_03265 [Bailinhaonella thermotolerans]|uniref:Uncharacterized protein n=1 Tax=Bailinhaonella thermotolerans TaxID=1070861 RepID=A0A3A4BB55_9ACTN|nr:hypothetical protein D5H75_03265 [Bailinhaonella thermotolerans]